MNEDIKGIAFPSHLLKGRHELIEICLRTCRYLNSIRPIPMKRPSIDHIALIVNKMSRIFYFSDKKYFSIALPIQIEIDNNSNLIFKFADKHISPEHLAWLVALHVNGKEIMENDLNYFEFLMDCEDSKFDFYSFYETFWEADYGYIRYDVDAQAYNEAVKKGKPHHHPLYHFDIHLPQYSTFKTGLTKSLTPVEFINYLDNEEERWYSVPSTSIKKVPNLKS